ncbi:MAG: hypothetical protein RLZZ422_1731 [Pseudomonadota bacterium]|jgi:flagellar motor switch/type III secretory pathway protein FliN
MNQEIQTILRRVLQRYGRDLVKQPSLCDAYLADFLPMHPTIRRYLVKALQSGIVSQMLPEPDPSKFMDLSKQLARVTSIDLPQAREIIQYWAHALASNPNQLIPTLTTNKPKVLSTTVLGASVLTMGLLLGGGWAFYQWQATPAYAVATVVESSDLMSGAKPVFIEVVEVTNKAATVQGQSTPNTQGLSFVPIAQATLAMTSNTAWAATTENPSASTLTNLAEPVLPNALANLSPEQLQRFQQVQHTQQLNQDALNALQHFVEHHQRYAQKKQSLQTINLMWANTQQPYYQQQQQAMSGQLQQLEQQLDESLGLYNTALQGLCSVVNGDVLLLDTIQGSSLQNIIKQHVSECQANQVLALSREQMIQGLQMLQASN